METSWQDQNFVFILVCLSLEFSTTFCIFLPEASACCFLQDYPLQPILLKDLSWPEPKLFLKYHWRLLLGVRLSSTKEQIKSACPFSLYSSFSLLVPETFPSFIPFWKEESNDPTADSIPDQLPLTWLPTPTTQRQLWSHHSQTH